MTTQTIRNGTSIDVPIPTGQTLKVVAVTGTYTITVTRGTGIGTALATAATGGSYGAYAYDSVVRIVASSASEIDFDVAVTPDVATDTVANYAFDPLTGAVTGLVGPGGRLYGLPRKKIAVAILGQSNERGQVLQTDATAYPQSAGSLINTGFNGAIDGVTSLQSTTTGVYGSPWFAFYDGLLAHGYEAQIFNGAIGSMSMVSHAAGQILSARANSTAYHERRSSSDREDFGYAGDFTVQSGKLFVCTTGRKRFASARAQYRADLPLNSVPKYDYIGAIGSQASAGSDPATWGAAALGATVTDGTVVWTNVNDTTPVSAGSILSENQAGLGFDPLGILERIHLSMQKIQGIESRHIIISNGQSDASQTQLNYQTALANVARFFLRRGYYVWIGLSCYSPTTTTANYDTLTLGVNAAVTTCQGDAVWGSRCYAGANNYTLMGSTGNMGSGGAYLQGDNVHLNGAGAIVFGTNWADRFKSVLPQL